MRKTMGVKDACSLAHGHRTKHVGAPAAPDASDERAALDCGATNRTEGASGCDELAKPHSSTDETHWWFAYAIHSAVDGRLCGASEEIDAVRAVKQITAAKAMRPPRSAGRSFDLFIRTCYMRGDRKRAHGPSMSCSRIRVIIGNCRPPGRPS